MAPRTPLGTNTRILRLNDYDFARRALPTLRTHPTAIHYGVASTATKTFPASPNEPFKLLEFGSVCARHLENLEDADRTFGIRDTLNSNPLNPHDQIARLRGSFASIPHDVNQPLNTAFKPVSVTYFHRRPSPSCNANGAAKYRERRSLVCRTAKNSFG